MIHLHKLSHDREPFLLNPDLIATIECHPDTMLHLTTGVHLAVAESADDVVAKSLEWRTRVAAGALRTANARS